MARKNRKAKNTPLPWDEVPEDGGGFNIEEGEYRMRFESVERGESNNGNDQLVWDFVGLEGEAKKKTFRVWTSLEVQALWKLGQLLDAMGIERPESVEEVIEAVEEADPAPEIIGVVQDDTYQGKTRSKLMDFINPDEAESGGKKKKKKKGDDDGDDDAGGKSKKNKKGKKGPTMYAEDEVRGMDEEELADLVKEEELDVDLDDYKTLRKKAAAVVEALEANDQIETD